MPRYFLGLAGRERERKREEAAKERGKIKIYNSLMP
jgi:hypothetical protein